MTTTPPVTAPKTAETGGLYATPAKTAPKKEMDKETFLNLLVAQLRNQDPSSPMDTNEMMAQSTQLASMERLTELTDTSRESFGLQMRVAASSFIGREVSWTDADKVKQTGVVSAVDFSDSVPTVKVGDKSIPLDAVSEVRVPTTTAPKA